MSLSSSSAIRCIGLRKRFGDVVAVDGLDLEVRSGECFGLLGPNGAGKTTTIEILEGLTRADEGDVTILGERWSGNGRRLKERIGISLQETRFSDKTTVLETLYLFRSFYREGRDPRELLRQLSLEEKANARVEKLSGGQRQRLAVACALIGKPEILFLDEPTTGLDPQSRLELWGQVHRYLEGGGTVLLTTHYMEEAERLCNRVAVVDRGQVIAQGTPHDLIATLEGANVIEFSSAPMLDAETLLALPGVHGCHRRGPNWSLRVDTLPNAVPVLLERIESSGAKLGHLSTHRATLEDLFVSLTGRELREE